MSLPYGRCCTWVDVQKHPEHTGVEAWCYGVLALTAAFVFPLVGISAERWFFSLGF
jgi:hypothetical protein